MTRPQPTPPDAPRAERASTTDGLPVAPGLGPALDAAGVATAPGAGLDRRTLWLSLLAVATALVTAVVAQGLLYLIAAITNLAYYGRFSLAAVTPAGHHLGVAAVGVPVVGALVVGVMARFGSPAIRGHGIPEAMERVLLHQSRIPPRLTLLKPLSAAVSIGTGGPFGAEGPIIATGGALGSLVGQVFQTSAHERKTLLAAGAAAGMAATFGSPVAAVLLAVELLLFEFGPRSLVPVALAAATAAGVRGALLGWAPVFPLGTLPALHATALLVYVALGAVMGVASVGVTRAVYAVEDAFERLPFHWMWWPALGAVAVGLVGLVAPRTLGVGYDNIEAVLSGGLTAQALIVLGGLKFVSWALSLGSGTSGGTLAPIFTIGGASGAAVGMALAAGLPWLGVDPRVAGLVGMAALFSGASRALLTSVVFAFETTRQPAGLLPLLGGCTAAFLVSSLLMQHSIMTTRIARRGIRVPEAYLPDAFQQLHVGACASTEVVTLAGEATLAEVRTRLEAADPDAKHQGFPVVDLSGTLLGVVTRRDVFEGPRLPFTLDSPLATLVSRPAVVVTREATLSEALARMARHDIGRLAVVTDREPGRVVGMLTRRDVLTALQQRTAAERRPERGTGRAGLRMGSVRRIDPAVPPRAEVAGD